MKKNLGQRIARRYKALLGLCLIILLGIFILVISNSYNINWLKEIAEMLISALTSTALAIYMTKDDILDNDYAEKRDDFGVLTFEDGYREVFRNQDSVTYLKASDWMQFFQKSIDKKIYFVGISFYNFFDDPKMRNNIYQLCINNDFDIDIILANPFGMETIRVNEVEEKAVYDDLKQRIIKTYKLFENDLNKMPDSEEKNKIKKKLHIRFSDAFPTTLLIKAGKYMIISPYMLENPDRAPTIIAEDSKSQSFFEKYNNYLSVIQQHSHLYTQLRENLPSNYFFTQSYTNLSESFYYDIKNSNYVAIIGLGQSRMIRTLGNIYGELLDKGVQIDIILTDPDGQSTAMCTKRSSNNRGDVQGDIEVHKETINRLIDLKKRGTINVYISDFMYPYTMYAFNCKDEVSEKTKMYIWQTVLFEPSEKRPGFVLEGSEDMERMKSYYFQFCELKNHCDLTNKIEQEYTSLNNKSCEYQEQA